LCKQEKDKQQAKKPCPIFQKAAIVNKPKVKKA